MCAPTGASFEAPPNAPLDIAAGSPPSMTKLRVMTFVGLLGLVFNSCKGADSVVSASRATKPSVAVSVAVLLASDVLAFGDTTTARAEVRDAANRVMQPRQVTWSSADPITASVSQQGLVTALTQGSTDIVAEVAGVSGRARVFVLDTASSAAAAPIEPELPRDTIDVSWRAPTGRTIQVNSGDDLQRALESAKRGDEVVIAAGAEFRGHFTLPAKSGTAADGWITVRTSALGQLPASGTRIDPAVHATAMPKLVTPDLGGALATRPGASGWRLVGLEITVAPGVALMPQIQQGIVLLGDGAQAQMSQVPTDLILDRVYIHGQSNTNTKRCVALNSARTAIVDSQLLECHGKGFDSQAIGTWNGPGPYRIENNRLEAGAEVIIFGGDRPNVHDLVPSDITIRRNHMTRPMSWKGVWTVKTVFELKNAQRVLVEGNVMENSWVDGQIGFAVTMGSFDTSYPWCIVQDVTMRYNHIDNSAGAFNLNEHYGNALPMRRVSIRHNLVTNIGAQGLGLNGRMFQIVGQINDLTIENNTGFSPKIYITFGDQPRPMARFSFRNNIGGDADYPIHSGPALGAKALALYTAPGSRFEGNVIVVRQPPRDLPPNNSYVASRDDIGFDSGAAGIIGWRLVRESRFFGGGAGAGTPGVDIDALLKRLNGVGGVFSTPATRRR